MQTNPDQTADLTAMQEVIDRGLLMATFDDPGCQVLVFDADSQRIVAANMRAKTALDATMRKLQQRHIKDVLLLTEPARITRILRMIRQRKKQSAAIRCMLKPETCTTVDLQIRFVAGKKNSFLVFLRDATDKTTAIQKAGLAESRLHTAIEALTDGFILFDADDRLVMCNERYRDIYKESAPALVPGAKHEDILRYGLRNNQYMLGYGTEDEWVARQEAAFKNLNISSEQRLNDGRWMRVVERPTPDGGRVGLRTDITQLKDQQDELRRLSRTDDLTGLLNRRGLARRLGVLAAGLSSEKRLAVLHVDLDRFKAVNDVQGHDAGDFVLQTCAQILSTGLPVPDAVARVGGDEFILVKTTDKSDKTIERYARRLISQISQPIMFRTQSCLIGASVGIAFVTNMNAADSEDVLTAANIALNQAKEIGGNEVLLFHQDMRTETIRQDEMAREIKKGIANNEFMPFFQPQVDTKTDVILGFEALIRWQHPVLGLIPAFQFLPVAQRAGLTDALDEIVMHNACFALRELMTWGVKDPCISINLSTAQISDPRIVSRLKGPMKKYGITTQNLRVELLESTLLDERSSKIIQNVHALIKAGFMVELDDFGTGHAAIATLRKFAVSRIKVDRSLVQDIDTDRELQVITAAVIDLAKRLGIDALAEGVETGLEQTTLQKMGCFYAQGFLHAKPMSLEAIKPWLEQRGDISVSEEGTDRA